MPAEKKERREQRLGSILRSHDDVDQALAKVCFLNRAVECFKEIIYQWQAELGVSPQEAFIGTKVLTTGIEEHLKRAKNELDQLIEIEEREVRERFLALA